MDSVENEEGGVENVEGRGAIGEGKLAHYSLGGACGGGTPGATDLYFYTAALV